MKGKKSAKDLENNNYIKKENNLKIKDDLHRRS